MHRNKFCIYTCVNFAMASLSGQHILRKYTIGYSRKPKDRHYNGQTNKDKMTNNDQLNTTQKTKRSRNTNPTKIASSNALFIKQITIRSTSSAISNQLRDIDPICWCCWNVVTLK